MRSVVDIVNEYCICTGRSNQELAEYVNILIFKGFQPHGFVYTSTQENGFFFHQAMVKYEGVKKPVSRKTKN